MKNKRINRILLKIGVFIFWIAVWQIVYMLVNVDLLIASPLQVASRIIELAGTAAFWRALGESMLRILAGFLAALAAGAALAVFTSFVPLADAFFRPLLSLIKATPVASFIILALVWIATGRVPIFTSFLMVLPLVWGNVSQGFKATDPRLLEMARVFGVRKGKVFSRIYLPSALPYFVAAATTGMGLAWKAGIAAEVLCRPEFSIGGALYGAKIYLETADLFAWTAVLIALSIVLERLFVFLMKGAARRFGAMLPGEIKK